MEEGEPGRPLRPANPTSNGNHERRSMRWRTASIVDEIAKKAARTEKDAADQDLSCGFELIASLPRSMERRFRLRYIPVQPMAQPSVELARGFAFDSFALAEKFSSALKLSGSGRRLAELANGCQQ